MRHVMIPNTDLNVSSVCLGGGPFGSALDETASFAMLDAFANAGGNFIDTARVYAAWIPGGMGISERVIGSWLRQRGGRHDMIVATKGGHPELATMSVSRLSAQVLASDCEDSLRALGVEALPLFWLHRDDLQRPVADILESLERLVSAGKIRYYGCSNWHPSRMREASLWAESQGVTGFVANQPLWSFATVNPASLGDATMRYMTDEMLDWHEQTGMPAVPYTSQARGFFAKADHDGVSNLPAGLTTAYDNVVNRGRLARLQKIARDTGHSVATLALVALMAPRAFTTIPIIGATRLDQLNTSLTAASVDLSTEQLSYLWGAGDR